MRWYLETTEWADNTPNGEYLMNDSRSKVYAYRSPVTRDIKVFTTPLVISTRGRRFVVNAQQYKVTVDTEAEQGRTVPVQGSRGDTYQVTERLGAWTCTCSGFQFRGRCRHIEQVKGAQHA